MIRTTSNHSPFFLSASPHYGIFYANQDFNPPLLMVAIALSMAALDYNRDAIVIGIESVAVWRGP